MGFPLLARNLLLGILCIGVVAPALAIGTVYPLDTALSTFNFTEDRYSDSLPEGVRFSFPIPATGRYILRVQNTDSYTSKRANYYGTDADFSSPLWSDASSYIINREFSGTSGEIHYFSLQPTSIGYYSHSFDIGILPKYKLTILSGLGGYTSPADSVFKEADQRFYLYASTDSGYRFSHWAVTSGQLVVSDSTDASIYLSLTQNATIQAEFKQVFIYPLPATIDTFNFSEHRYENNHYAGVRFVFIAPSAGHFTVKVANDSATTSKSLLYYQNDSTFTSHVTRKTTYDSLQIAFTATHSGEKLFFRVRPEHYSGNSRNFTIFYQPTFRLLALTDGNGAVTPDTALWEGKPISLSAAGYPGYRFNHWSFTSGNPTLSDTGSAVTMVSLVGDAIVQANFEASAIHVIDTVLDTFNFTTHRFSDTLSQGVRFSFQAPTTGFFKIRVLNSNGYTYKRLNYFHTRSAFDSLVWSETDAYELGRHFFVNAGEVHYFTVNPHSTSYNTYDFLIGVANLFKLTILTDGNGSTNPADSVRETAGATVNLTASGNTGYRFKSWTVITGSPEISDTASMTTSIVMSGNAAIRADFETTNLYALDTTLDTFNFTSHRYSDTLSQGVRFFFQVPATGYYQLRARNTGRSTNKTLRYYHTKSAFDSLVWSDRDYGEINYRFYGIIGETHFMSVSPNSSSHYTSDFRAGLAYMYKLTLNSSGNGITNPADSVIELAGEPFNLPGVQADSGYRFSHWSVSYGNPEIDDSTLTGAEFTLSGNAGIQANFVPKTINIIQTQWKTFNYTVHRYGDHPSGGVAFRYPAPLPGGYAVSLDNVDSTFKRLDYFQTDANLVSLNSRESGEGRLDLYFNSAAAGVNHYFMAVPLGAAHLKKNFRIRACIPVNLTVQSDTNGHTDSMGTVSVLAGIPVTVTAVGKPGYKLDYWDVLSGTVTFDNPRLSQVRITTESNATVQARFTQQRRLTISQLHQDYNYSEHSYTGDPEEGVWLSFTTPATGRFSITVEDIDSTDKTLEYYGQNASQTSSLDLASGVSSIGLIIRAEDPNEVHYFKVKPGAKTTWNNRFRIYVAPPCTLTVTSDPNGSVSSPGEREVPNNAWVTISATPSTLYNFNGWTTEQSSAVFQHSDSARTSVKIIANTTIRANFIPGVLQSITSTIDTLNFTTHRFKTDPAKGVWLFFEAPSIGEFAVFADDAGTPHQKSFYDFASDSSFTGPSSTQIGDSALAFMVNATAPGQKFYFKVVPQPDRLAENFTVWADTPYRLQLSNDGNGTTNPSGMVYVMPGGSHPIEAIAGADFKFNRWEVVSGSVVINDTSDFSTSARLTSNAELKAHFISGVVWPVHMTPDTLNFTDHSYKTSPLDGVRLYFQAPGIGHYAVSVGGLGSTYYKYFEFHGRDSSFTSVDSSKSGYSEYAFIFRADHPGEKFYFTLFPRSGYETRDFVTVAVVPYRLLVSDNGLGTTTPADTTYIIPGKSQDIEAIADSGYKFSRWEILEGKVAISDSTQANTTAHLGSDASIRAQFALGLIHPITMRDTIYNTTVQSWSSNLPEQVRMAFTAPAAGEFAVTADPANFNVWFDYFGKDTSFSNRVHRESGYREEIHIYITAGAAGEKHYFTVSQQYTHIKNRNFRIKASNVHFITIQTDGNGAAYPEGVVKLIEGRSGEIEAESHDGFKFENWTVISGNPVIADSQAFNTTVFVNTSDAVIRANFKPAVVYEIKTVRDTFNFVTHSYNEHYEDGVRFYFQPVHAGDWAVVLRNVTYNNKIIRYHGTDSVFQNFVSADTGTSDLVLFFQANAALGKQYFTVSPNGSYRGSFDIIATDTVLTLNITNNGHGATSPSGAVKVLKSGSVNISATADSAYKFQSWLPISGNPVLLDTGSRSTTVNIMQDAEVRAFFSPGAVHLLSYFDSSYHQRDDSFDEDLSRGVRFVFTASGTGLYGVVINNWGPSRYTNLVHHGQDAQFNKVLQTNNVNAGQEILFSATGTENHYFSVQPDYGSYTSFSIRAHDSIYVLSLTTDGNGTAGYAGDSLVSPGSLLGITASPNSGWLFDKWQVIAGSAVMSDTTNASTQVKLSSNATLKALFAKGEVYAIKMFPFVYNFSTHKHGAKISNGVAFYFNAPARGKYAVIAGESNRVNKTLIAYGSDSTFSTSRDSSRATAAASVFFRADSAGQIFYFKVKPTSSSSSSDFSIRAADSAASLDTLIIVHEENGFIYPSDTLTINYKQTKDIAAIPFGGALFHKWTVDSGEVVISDSANPLVSISLPEGNARLRAHFVPDTNAVLKLDISTLSIDSHPRICVTTMVYDSLTDRGIVGLKDSLFSVYQDDQDQAFSFSPISGVSMVILADRSSSMKGAKLDNAKSAMRLFTSLLSPQDRASIISFGTEGQVKVERGLTSNKAALESAIDGISAEGGTGILEGVHKSVEVLSGETNFKSIILFSDGADESKNYTLDSVVNYANSHNVKIYSIGIEDSISVPLKPLAERTSGYYSYIASAADLDRVISTIENDIRAHYRICYSSPDTVIDGDWHQVKVETKLLNRVLSDTASWFEKNDTCNIQLTGQSADYLNTSIRPYDAIPVSVTASDKGALAWVRLTYKNLGSNTSGTAVMSLLRDSTYSAFVPSQQVYSPGLEFSAQCMDDKGLAGTIGPYLIEINNQAPIISHTPAICRDPGAELHLAAGIADDDSIQTAQVYYRTAKTDSFLSIDMASPDNKFEATLPKSDAAGEDLEYYFKATDRFGRNTVNPRNGFYSIPQCPRLTPPEAVKLTSLHYPDSLFEDYLAMILRSPSDSAIDSIRVYYTLDSTLPSVKLSSFVYSGDTLSFHRSVFIRAISVSGNTHLPSTVSQFTYEKVPQVPYPIIAKPGAENYPDHMFLDSVYVTFSLPPVDDTAAYLIFYTLDGSSPGTGKSPSVTNGDSILIKSSTKIRAIATRRNWKNSGISDTVFTKVRQVPKPKFLKRDPHGYPDSLFQDSIYVIITCGAKTDSFNILYTTNGDMPENSSRTIASGDSILIKSTVTIKALGAKQYWLVSEPGEKRFEKVRQVQKPQADPGDSSWFRDRLCVRLTTETKKARIRYSLDGGDPGDSPTTLASGDSTCFDTTVHLTAQARRLNWKNSETLSHHYFKMKQVEKPVPDSSTDKEYQDPICIHLTSETEGADIHYTLDGGPPDSSSPVLAPEDTLCLDQNTSIRTFGRKLNWIDSDTMEYFFKVYKDTIGPYIKEAEKRPTSLEVIERDGKCLLYEPDTLVVTLTEGIMPQSEKSDWATLVLYSDSTNCRYDKSTPLPLHSDDVQKDGNRILKYILSNQNYLSRPMVGDCVFLDTTAAFTDLSGNSIIRGVENVRIKGRDTSPVYFLGPYPYVAGTEKLDKKEQILPGSSCFPELPEGRQWIPPAGDNCRKTAAAWEPLPDCIQTMPIITGEAYEAQVTIHNNLGQFITAFNQSFGECGELGSPAGMVPYSKKISFLVWDLKDSQGKYISSGAYIWKIRLLFEDKNREKDGFRIFKSGYVKSGKCGK